MDLPSVVAYHLSVGVEQLSSGSNHIAAASDDLAQLASGLQERVGRFRV